MGRRKDYGIMGKPECWVTDDYRSRLEKDALEDVKNGMARHAMMLYCQDFIEESEYRRLIEMIRSEDQENLELAVQLIESIGKGIQK